MTLLDALNKLGDDAGTVLLTTVFDKAAIGLGILDPNLNFVWANTKLKSSYGIETTDLTGRSFAETIGEAAWQPRHKLLEHVLLGETQCDQEVEPPIKVMFGVNTCVKTSYLPVGSSSGVLGVLLIAEEHAVSIAANSQLIHQAMLDLKHSENENSDLVAKIHNFAITQATFLRDVLASVTDGKLRLCQTPDQLPPKGLADGDEVSLSEFAGLRELRHSSKNAAVKAGFIDGRWQDLITAVSEGGMNAIVHAGGGVGQVCLCGNDSVQVWIRDTGKGIELENLPRATLEKGYTTKGTMGHGMKLMLQTSDRVWLLTGPSGTTVVLEQDREAHKPYWI